MQHLQKTAWHTTELYKKYTVYSIVYTTLQFLVHSIPYTTVYSILYTAVYSGYILYHILQYLVGFPESSVGKDSACNAGDLVQFLGWEDPLEKGQATHSCILGLPL